MKSWPNMKLLLAPIWFLLPLFDPKIHFFSIFSLIYQYLPIFCLILHYNYHYLVIFALNCADFTICILRNLGIQKVSSRMQFEWLSRHWQFVVCIFWCFTPVSNFRAIGQLLMEIFHVEDLWDTESFGCERSCSSVWKVSNLNSNVHLGDKVVLQCIGNWQCYATLKSSRTDRHTRTASAVRLN